MDNYAIELLHITKVFPGIVANDDITLRVRYGEIHALLGENGAGKSTLMSVLFGLYQPEEGEILVNGKKAEIKNPRTANALGIGMVHQHFMLVQNFTVLENIVLGVETAKHGVLQMEEARKKVLALSERYGLNIDCDARVSDITVGMQQRVEILKMLYKDNNILIFDEPTAVLTPQEIDELTLIFLVPLLLVGLGDLFSERSGVLNIALEGIMVFGAFAGIMFIRSASAAMPSWLVLLIAILISILAGILLSSLHAFASIHLKAEQTISSTAIITFATAFCIFYARVMLGTEQVVFRNTFRIDAVPLLSKIPVLGPILFQKAYVTTYLGILVLIVTAFILKRTRFGLRLRSCGENPQAADSVGISVYKMRYSGVLISGALAGLGGLVFILPTTTTYTASVSGYGFLAMSVVVFGQWKPWGIALGALFFGLTKTIAASYSVIPFLYNLGIPEAFFKMLPYVATLIVLAFSTKRSNAPGVIGVPYDKSKR